jgi:hypothetical protein
MTNNNNNNNNNLNIKVYIFLIIFRVYNIISLIKIFVRRLSA